MQKCFRLKKKVSVCITKLRMRKKIYRGVLRLVSLYLPTQRGLNKSDETQYTGWTSTTLQYMCMSHSEIRVTIQSFSWKT